MAVLEALREQSGFTQTDQALADYVLAHADDVVHMRITELARLSFTSTAAVNRLCRKVGVAGFGELKVDLSSDLERSRGTREVSPNLILQEGQSALAIIDDMEGIYRRAASLCADTLDGLELHKAAKAMSRCQHVVMYGSGNAAASCEILMNDLEKIGVVAVPAYRYSNAWAATHLVRKGDVALVVSYSGKLIDGVAPHIRVARESGATTVAVTSRDLGKGRLSGFDCYLRLPKGEKLADSSGTFFSQVCIRFVLSCLYAAVFSLDSEGNAAHKTAVETPDWG